MAVLLGAAGAWAGSIKGTIKYEGEAPVLKPVEMTADAACAAMHKEPVPNEVLVLGPGNTLANVLVRVTKGAAAKEYPVPSEPVVVTQQGCRYAPRVFVVRKGQTVKVLNPDGILHNVHSIPKTNAALNKAMPAAMTELETLMDKVEEEPFAFKCDIHPWMLAWCVVLDHPFHAVTGTDGTYVIDGLEPGEYELSAWHERLGTQTLTVTVADAPATADFSFSRSGARK
jgi:plastocyanin